MNFVRIAIQELELHNSYPLIKKNLYTCKEYIYLALKKSKLYSAEITQMNNLLCTDAYINVDDFISKSCAKMARDHGNLVHIYRIYHKNKFDNFTATKYISDFCSRTTEQILKAFDLINPIHRVPLKIKSNLNMYADLKHIFDTMLIIELANIFSLLECYMNMGCVRLVSAYSRSIYSQLITNIIANMVTDKITISNNFTYEYFLKTYPLQMNNVIRISTPFKLSCTKKDVQNKITSIILSLLSKVLAISLRVISKKISPIISKNINFKAIYGIQKSNYIASDCLNPQTSLDNFFKYIIIDEIFDKIEDDLEGIELKIIPDLIMPNKSVDIDEDLEIDDYLVIEI